MVVVFIVQQVAVSFWTFHGRGINDRSKALEH